MKILKETKLFIKKETSDKLMFYTLNNGVLGQIRTADLSLRRRLLYPTELQGHNLILPYNVKIDYSLM